VTSVPGDAFRDGLGIHLEKVKFLYGESKLAQSEFHMLLDIGFGDGFLDTVPSKK
jgi:hypothetical protein